MSSTTMKIGSGIHWVSRGFFYLGWVAASVMLVITCYDVFMRYLFAKPTSWAVELGAVLLVYMGFICAAELVRRGQHIDMSILTNRLSKRARDALMCLFLCWSSCFVQSWSGWALRPLSQHINMACTWPVNFACLCGLFI